MRIARKLVRGQPEFFLSNNGQAFVGVSELGLPHGTLGELAQNLDSVRNVLDQHPGVVESRPVDGDHFLQPIFPVGSVIGIGLNYRDHVRESSLQVPNSPRMLAKLPNSLTGADGEVCLDSAFTTSLDYEVELGFVIGRRIARGTRGAGLESVLGFVVANDVTARDVQFTDGDWVRAKGADSFCPIGPWITTVDEVADPQSLVLKCWVNDELRQHSSTSQMVFGVVELMAFISRTVSLEVGDLVITGTPAGVGMGMRPPVWLGPGDSVRCEIEGLGTLTNVVRDAKEFTAHSEERETA